MSQSLSQIGVHIIFSTKNRYPFLSDNNIRIKMYDYINAICLQQKCNALKIGGVNDHIHLLIRLHKNKPLSQLIEIIKKSSSKWIKEIDKNNPLLKKFYWQRGYGAFSVSQSNIDSVKAYIENQGVHHQKQSFQDELRKLFILHEVEYNENYIWE